MIVFCRPVIVLCVRVYLNFKRMSLIKIDSYFLQESDTSMALLISCSNSSTYSCSICIFRLFAYCLGNIYFQWRTASFSPHFQTLKKQAISINVLLFYWRWQLLFISTRKFLTSVPFNLPTQELLGYMVWELDGYSWLHVKPPCCLAWGFMQQDVVRKTDKDSDPEQRLGFFFFSKRG